MSYGIFQLQPDVNNLSQLSVVTMPAMANRVGGVKTGANVAIAADGTISVAAATEPANTVWAGPSSGAAAAPAFRTLVSADVPQVIKVNGTPVGV